MTFYRRNLPHWHPEGRPLFVTWRLHGTLPASVAFHKAVGSKPTPAADAGRVFVEWDRLLDRASVGPTWLKDPRIARIVVHAIEQGQTELGFYKVHAYAVMSMSNHVHVLFTPVVDIRRILRGLKGVTACRANRVLGRRGRPFWQDEFFDHWVRDGRELERIASYIEWNPVKAGLVEYPEDWKWSSAARGTDHPVCFSSYR